MAEENLEYTLSDDGTYYIVTGIGTYTNTNIVIPLSYDNKPIKEIGNNAFFENTALTNVTISNSIISIGEYAFKNCSNLISIIFEDNSQLEIINKQAFYNCSNLTSITLPNSLTSIGDAVFYYCSNLTNITIPNNVINIGNSAFRKCNKLSNIIIQNGVQIIGEYVFEDCDSLISITIPSSITSIGLSTFANCNRLTTVIFSNNSQLEIIPRSLFSRCSNLTNITLPDSITIIGYEAFYGCRNLKKIILPINLTDMENRVFVNCINLDEILVAEGNLNYKSIDGNLYTKDGKTLVQYAIGKKTKIFKIPATTTELHSGAFQSSPYLETIYIPSSITSIGSSAFSDINSLLYILYEMDYDKWNLINGHNYVSMNKLYFYQEEQPKLLDKNYWHYVDNKFSIYTTLIIEDVMLKNNNTISDGYKTMIVPIKINTDYTIYIDSSIPIYIAAIYYDGVNILTDYKQDKEAFKIFDYTLKTRCSFNQPFLYRIDKEETFTDKEGSIADETILQNQLVMLIQIPEINTSTVLVLEGDYTNNKLINTSIYDNESNVIKKVQNGIKELYYGEPLKEIKENRLINEYFNSGVSSLTQIFDGQNYAFNDRLIEYLLLNVITKNDDITDNIKRIQEYISSYKSLSQLGERYKNTYVKGVWDLQMRQYIYNLITQKYNKPIGIDINGFVDKDTEAIIEQCKEKK